MLMNTKQAGEYLGLSPTRIVQLIKPDSRVPRRGDSGGGTPLCMYSKQSLDNFKKTRDERDQRKVVKALEKELEGVTKPSDAWLSITEAWLFLDKKFNKNVIRANCKHIPIKGRPFFHKADLRAIPDDAVYVPSKKRKQRVCVKCGREYKGHGDLCRVCKTGYDEDDPYGVRLAPKKQKYRKCPECGGDLFEGEYKCARCKNLGNSDLEFDEYEAYGEMSLPLRS